MNRKLNAKGLGLFLCLILLVSSACQNSQDTAAKKTIDNSGTTDSVKKSASKTWTLEQDFKHKAYQAIQSIEFSPDSQTLAVGDIGWSGVFIVKFKDGKFDPTDIKTVQMCQRSEGDNISNMEFSKDGNTIVSSGMGSVWVWDAKTCKLKKNWEIGSFGKDFIGQVAVSPNGQTVAIPSGKSDAKILEVQTGKVLKTLSGHSDSVFDIEFSPDGKTIATGSNDKTIKLWDVDSGQVKQTLNGHTGKVSRVVFSKDGTLLASSGDDKTVRIWDVQSGALKQTLNGHGESRIMGLAFSPDGSTLASGSNDKTVKLWDVQSGSLSQTISDHNDVVGTLAFSPDGKRLATASRTNIKFWVTK